MHPRRTSPTPPQRSLTLPDAGNFSTNASGSHLMAHITQNILRGVVVILSVEWRPRVQCTSAVVPQCATKYRALAYSKPQRRGTETVSYGAYCVREVN